MYTLNTVMYSLACSAFLSCRTLIQLVQDEGNPYLEAFQAILNFFYVDDLVTGSQNRAEAIKLQLQITELLKLSGFPIRKRSSNDSVVLQLIPISDRSEQINTELTDQNFKILGLIWDKQADRFK